MLDDVIIQLALLAQLEVDVLLVVLALDVAGTLMVSDVCLLLYQAQQCHDDSGEVGRRGRITGWLRRHARCLRRDESVGGDPRASLVSVQRRPGTE